MLSCCELRFPMPRTLRALLLSLSMCPGATGLPTTPGTRPLPAVLSLELLGRRLEPLPGQHHSLATSVPLLSCGGCLWSQHELFLQDTQGAHRGCPRVEFAPLAENSRV